MRFGTYYFLQAPPALAHPEVVRREIEQMAWTEELGFDIVAETVAFGSPDTVAEKIGQLQRLGIGEVLCWMNFGGLPQERVRRSMELFAREVIPRFR